MGRGEAGLGFEEGRLRSLKVAVVHDWLMSWAGAEKVVAEMLRLLPRADLFTGVYDPLLLKEHLPGREVKATSLQRLPKPLKRKFRTFLPLMPAFFEALDLSGYDLVISSSHAFSKCVIPPEGTKHFCYCYTPPRYLWHQRHLYAGRVPGPLRPLWWAVCSYLRAVDFQAAQRVDGFMAVSKAAARRVEHFYRKRAEVVYPPVEVERFSPTASHDGFYLCVSRLVPYKRVDIAIGVARRLGRRLVVVGDGPERRRLERLASGNVQFLGHVSEEELVSLYHRCRALLFPAEEDFGIVMVEAQAAGKPVVAYGKGGATEIVKDGQTGVLFYQQEVETASEAILRLERTDFDPQAARENAERFSRRSFEEAFLSFSSRNISSREGSATKSGQGVV